VTDLVRNAFGYTARLAVVAGTIGIVFGLTLGIIAALNRGKRLDHAISAWAAGVLSIPSFVSGMLLILLFAVILRWLPPSGAGEPGNIMSQLRALILPALALGFPFAAILARFMRGALIEVLGQDYVLTARAKGLRSATVIGHHEVRNALIPTVTVMGIGLGGLLAGAVVVETVFSYPGLGRLVVSSIFNRDYPVVQAGLIVGSAVFLGMSLLADLTYGLLDPRIALARQKR
ncbi:MAG: ABC transporter permease, partial [Acidimicrobiia bacterium]